VGVRERGTVTCLSEADAGSDVAAMPVPGRARRRPTMSCREPNTGSPTPASPTRTRSSPKTDPTVGPPGHQLLHRRGELGRQGGQARAQDGNCAVSPTGEVVFDDVRCAASNSLAKRSGLHDRHDTPSIAAPPERSEPGRSGSPSAPSTTLRVHESNAKHLAAHRRLPGAAVHAGRPWP